MNTMFSPVGIAGTLNAVVSMLIAVRLFSTYEKTRNVAQQHFLFFYLYLGAFYFLFAFPQLVLPVTAGVVIGAFHIVSYFFLGTSLSYLLTFPYQLTGRGIPARKILIGMFAFNILYLLGRIIAFEPSTAETVAGTLYWHPFFPSWMRVLMGLVAVSAAGIVSGFFFRFGWQNKKDIYLFYRSWWLGFGTSILMMGATAGLIAAPTGSAQLVYMATAFVLAGLLITLRGVYYPAAVPKPLTPPL